MILKKEKYHQGSFLKALRIDPMIFEEKYPVELMLDLLKGSMTGPELYLMMTLLSQIEKNYTEY